MAIDAKGGTRMRFYQGLAVGLFLGTFVGIWVVALLVDSKLRELTKREEWRLYDSHRRGGR